jgi:hypothetical protein
LPGLVVKGFLLECHLSVLKIDKLAQVVERFPP